MTDIKDLIIAKQDSFIKYLIKKIAPIKRGKGTIKRALELASLKAQIPDTTINPTDTDITNAAKDYVDEKESRCREYGMVLGAYIAGAKDVRDSKIYIAPKDTIDGKTRPLIPSPQHQISEAIRMNKEIYGWDIIARQAEEDAKHDIEAVKKSIASDTEAGKDAELIEQREFLQGYEIFKALMEYNYSNVTYEDIIDDFLKYKQ